MTPEEVESQKQFRRSISRPLGATDEGTEVEQLRDAVWALADALAKRCLADANAEREAPNDWPAGQEWDELVGSSHSIMRGRAYAEAGLDRLTMVELLCTNGFPKPCRAALQAETDR